LEWFAKYKHPSLLVTLINYDQKKLDKLSSWPRVELPNSIFLLGMNETSAEEDDVKNVMRFEPDQFHIFVHWY
jgi:hypothetical protein